MDVKERIARSQMYHVLSPTVGMVGLIGLEPMTPALSRRCSNQLSYRPFITRGALVGSWWRHGDSNPGHPACKAGALPTELYPLTRRTKEEEDES